MAQAVGGAYGLPHGAMNAICVPAAMRFNAEVAAEELARFAEAMRAADGIARFEELARLSGYERLRDFDVPHDDLPRLAAAAAERRGALDNPRPAGPDEIAALFESVW